MQPKHEAGVHVWVSSLDTSAVIMTGVKVWVWRGSGPEIWETRAHNLVQPDPIQACCAMWQSASKWTKRNNGRRNLRSVSVTWSSAWDSNPESPDGEHVPLLHEMWQSEALVFQANWPPPLLLWMCYKRLGMMNQHRGSLTLARKDKTWFKFTSRALIRPETQEKSKKGGVSITHNPWDLLGKVSAPRRVFPFWMTEEGAALLEMHNFTHNWAPHHPSMTFKLTSDKNGSVWIIYIPIFSEHFDQQGGNRNPLHSHQTSTVIWTTFHWNKRFSSRR